MPNLIITNIRPHGGAETSITIKSGRIAAIGGPAEPGLKVFDGHGLLAIPGLVEAHAHLDKTLYGMPWYVNKVGPALLDKIDNERASKRTLGIDAHRQSARQVALTVGHGTTHIRTHVDVDTECGVTSIEGVMATKAAHADHVDMQIVAFPQSGLLRRPGTLELMDTAMRLGADAVGGIDPCSMDRDPKGHLDAVFGLAQRHGKGVDIHLHEPGEMGAFSMDLIIERAKALGMRGQSVVISHAFCLGMPDVAAVDRLLADLAAAEIAILTLGTPSRPVPPLLRARAAGVVVGTGSDGIRDTWGPYGDADILERAKILGMRNNLRHDTEVEQALDVCTHGGAKMMGISDYGIAIGKPADLVLLPGSCLTEAVVSRPVDRITFKRGRITARNGAAAFQVP
ncbi:MAG: amidohydrolase family protein [Alphaproteobacteria bacterium]|nr:amidohydrolase family protein [Alphaproteobacteria bacterium]